MTALEHALKCLRLAIDTGRAEFVRDAYNILDGVINANQTKSEPYRLPDGIKHMLKRRAEV